MIGNRLVHREADGVRTPGTWRPASIRNGGWERRRLAVMTRLLHARHDQHPDLGALTRAGVHGGA